jgi:translation initiation factor 2 alpha subunit (eIF-2alpha)
MNQPNPKTPEEIAAEFEAQSFDADALDEIKKTRRRSPRIGEARAEVYSFRAPPSYKDRIRRRASDENKSESEVIREALDAHLG